MKRINSLYVGVLIFFQLFNSFLSFGIYNNFKYASEDAWVSIIIMSVLGLLCLFCFFKIFYFEEKLSIIEKNKKIYGHFIGNVINIILVILFFLLGILFLYNISDFVSSQYLYKTPTSIIALILCLVCFINVSKGFGSLTKTGFLLFVFSVLLFFISALSLISSVDISNYKPVLKDGLNNPFIEGVILFINNILPIYLFLIIPIEEIKDKNKYKKYILFSYIIAILFIFFTTVITLGVSGIYLSKIYQYPEYMVLKNISLFTSIERVENILAMQWVIYAFASISMVIYYISSNISIKNINNNYIILLTTSIIWIGSKYIFSNNAMANYFFHNILPYIYGLFILIYLTSTILIIIRRKNVL